MHALHGNDHRQRPGGRRTPRLRRVPLTAALLTPLALCCLLGACGSGAGSPSPSPSSSPSLTTPTDYSNPAHWLSLPGKVDKKVDVFYLYPSEYTKADASAPIIGPA